MQNIENRDLLLKSYLIYLEILKNYSPVTVKLYHSTADSFLYFLYKNSILNLKKIQKSDFYHFIIYLNKKHEHSNRTKNLTIASLNNFISYMCKNHMDNFCQISKIKQMKFEQKRPNIIDSSTLLRLLDSKNPEKNKKLNDWLSYRNYALAILLYSTGMRISEAMNFSLTDIADGWIRIEKAKNHKCRVVPTNKILLLAIKNYINSCPYKIDKVLWFTKNGIKLKSNSATKSVFNYLGFHAHYLRHSFATHLVQNDCNLLVLKEFLGHSSLNTTSIYIHIQPKKLLNTIKFHPYYKYLSIV